MLNVRIKDEILHSQKEPGVMVLISTAEGENNYFKITGVSSQIFKGLAEKKTIDEIVKQMLSEYDVSENQLRADIDNFLNYLLENGIAEKV